MVKGLELFRRHFDGRSAGFVLIGGAACHEWFAQQALTFRATKDLDLVVVVEVLDDAFVEAFRASSGIECAASAPTRAGAQGRSFRGPGRLK